MRRLFRIILAILLTVALVYWLLRYVDINDVIRTVFAVNPSLLIASFLVYVISVVLRAVRFQRLLHVPARTMMPITFVHTCLLNLLPGIFGEMSYVYLTRRHGVPVGNSTAILVVCRIFDIAAVFVLTLLALLFVKDAPASFSTLLLILGASLLVVFILLVLFVIFRHRLESLGRTVAALFHITHLRVVQWSLAKLCEMADAIEKIKGVRVYTMIVLTSLFVWLFAYLQTYLLMIGMGYDIPFMTIALGTSLYRLTTILPVSGIAGFGTTEATWAGAFIVLGVAHDTAIISAFSIHLLQLVSALVVGIVGFFLLRSLKNTDGTQSL